MNEICIDILVDGRFVKALSENVTAIPWRGSTNQRVIDVKKTFATGNIVLLPGTEETTDYSMVINTQKCACACRQEEFIMDKDVKVDKKQKTHRFRVFI